MYDMSLSMASSVPFTDKEWKHLLTQNEKRELVKLKQIIKSNFQYKLETFQEEWLLQFLLPQKTAEKAADKLFNQLEMYEKYNMSSIPMDVVMDEVRKGL